MMNIQRSGAHFTDVTAATSAPAAPGFLDQATPYVLALLRVVVALLFFEHGTAKLFGFPAAGSIQVFPSLGWFAGAIEVVGGGLLAIGLFSRSAAFIMSGQMAVAYFMSHAPASFFPLINRGDSAILYCFIFFFLVFAGPGRFSLDGWWAGRRAR
jgi:putative oxidoreductase